MTLLFEDARRIADAADRSRFSGPGTFHVADYGLEDEALFYVITGAREWLVDGNSDFLKPSSKVLFVNRENGDVLRTDVSSVEDYLDDMTRVGDWPEDE